MAISASPGPPRRTYSILPHDDSLAARAVAVLAALDASGAHIAVMPELTLSASLVEVWSELLISTPPPLGSALRLLMVGTGMLERRPDGRGANRGTLMDRGGKILLQQDKRHPFMLTDAMVDDWGLAPLLGDGAASEAIVPGAPLNVAEAPFGRIILLVCEDLSRTMEHGTVLREVGASYCLAPVFSKPTLAHYWEHSYAKGSAPKWGQASSSATAW